MCQGLTLSYGVEPVELVDEPNNWRDYAQTWLQEHQIPGAFALLAAGPSTQNPYANYRIEFLKVGESKTDTSIGDFASERFSSSLTQSDAVVP